MTGTNSRYTIGNIVAAVLVMVFSAGLAAHAITTESSDRIGRNWQFVTALGVLGVFLAGGAVIEGIRSRRR